jgi:hypothetical protein
MLRPCWTTASKVDRRAAAGMSDTGNFDAPMPDAKTMRRRETTPAHQNGEIFAGRSGGRRCSTGN